MMDGKMMRGRPGVGMAQSPMPAAAMMQRSMTPMAPGSSIMPTGRAYAKGGMVGCNYTPKSSATMRGAARKGK